MLTRFIKALHEFRLETEEEVSDVLWLALQMQAKARETDAPSDEELMMNLTAQEEQKQAQEHQDWAKYDPLLPPTSSHLDQSRTGIHLSSQADSNDRKSSKGGLAFRSPAVTALPGTLGLGRVLRPLMKRVPSRNTFALDEEMTARRIADQLLTGSSISLPVLRPMPSRWLDVALIIDESRSMGIWQPTIQVFKRLLERHGAFRDVRTWGLVIDGNKVSVHPTGKSNKTRLRNASELIDPTGRRIILILSDCVSAMWYHHALIETFIGWGRKGPVAIVQMLPQRLWSRTALGDAVEVLLHAQSQGLPNAWLDYEPSSYLVEKQELTRHFPVPVVALEQEAFKQWIQAVVIAGNAWTPGYMLDPYAQHLLPITQADLSARERILNFSATSSSLARTLLGFLASAPISLPVIRLIQQTMLSQSDLSHVAEVLLGGLLEQSPSSEGEYDFVKGVRELLIEATPKSESLQVLVKVSDFIERHTGQALDIRALLANPGSTAELVINSTSRPFASVATKVFRRLGGDYRVLADGLDRSLNALNAVDAPPHRDEFYTSRQGVSVSTAGTDASFRQYAAEIAQLKTKIITEIRNIVEQFETILAEDVRNSEQPDLFELRQLMKAIIEYPRDIEHVKMLERYIDKIHNILQTHKHAFDTLADSKKRIAALLEIKELQEDSHDAQKIRQVCTGLQKINELIAPLIENITHGREQLSWADLFDLVGSVTKNRHDIDSITKLARKASSLDMVFRTQQEVLNTLTFCARQLKNILIEEEMYQIQSLLGRLDDIEALGENDLAYLANSARQLKNVLVEEEVNQLQSLLEKLDDIEVLGESNLTYLNGIATCIRQEGARLPSARGKIVHRILEETFDSMRKPGKQVNTDPEWESYNILYYRYFKHHLKNEKIANILGIASMRQYYRKQNVAVQTLLKRLKEMKVDISIDRKVEQRFRTQILNQKYPGLFVIMLDQSESMRQVDITTNISKADLVTTYVNRILETMTNLAQVDTYSGKRKNYAYVSVIGYNHDAYPLLSTSIAPLSLSDLDNLSLGFIPTVKLITDDTGNVVGRQVEKSCFWIKSQAQGQTDMTRAFEEAEKVIQYWLKSSPEHIVQDPGGQSQMPRQESFPPILINITDANHNGRQDPNEAVKRIRQLRTNYGHVLIYNCHITHEGTKPCIFPATLAELSQSTSDRQARLMFEMSSEIPDILREKAEEYVQVPISRSARCFIYNANPDILLRFLRWGTLSFT